MSLHNDFDGLLPEEPAAETLRLTNETVQLLRAQMAAAGETFSRPERVGREDHLIGTTKARLYRPDDCGTTVMMFLHGGGWLFGDLDTHDAMCAWLASEAKMAVLSVAYRLAPEHRYPAGLDDCDRAYSWMCGHAGAFGFDTVAIGGESAGANLAAAVTLRRLERGEPQPAFQFLIHPPTDMRFTTPGIDMVKGPGLDRNLMEQMRGLYLRTIEDQFDPGVSPYLAASHVGLASAVILTAECDPLRDDGEAYAMALATAGVETLVRRLPGLPHGFLFLPIEIPVVGQAYRLLGSLLQRYAGRR